MARLKDWNEEIENEADGHKKLTLAVSFLLAQIKRKAGFQPEDAEAARLHCAGEIRKLANSVTTSRRATTREGDHA